MSKFRTSILIIGMLVIVVAASLLTVFALFATGAVVTERIELYYAVFNAEKEYDGTPLVATNYELVSGKLQEGHYSVVEFKGSQTDAGISKSSLSVKICDKDGYDVTSGYKIGVSGGTLKVTRKSIAVTLNDAEVMYNGTKVSFEDYTVTEGSLVSGHKIAGSQNIQLISVNDELPSDLKPVVFDAAGNDVTKNYEVFFTMGTIRVVPRPVTVKPADAVKTYDGVEVTLGNVQILSGSLAEGQYFKGTEINYGDESYIDVCDVVTRITKIAIYQIVGTKEVDVTENYDLDYTSETGVVRIEKRLLTIAAKSQSWVYDGTDHTVTNGDIPLSCEGLAHGELLVSVKQSETIRNVGEKTQYVTDIKLSDNASLSNYEVVSIPGTLTVVARDVTIITPTISKTYDGKPLKGASPQNEPTSMNIAPNHELRYDLENLTPITECGVERNEIECTIVDKDDPDTDLTENYNVTYVYGTLTILKRSARITTLTYTKVYDGQTLYGYVDDSDIIKYNFVSGHEVVVPTGEDCPNITDVDRITNSYTVTVYDGEVDVTENYDISYQYGYLEITPLSIKVKTKGETRQYNGETLRRDDTDFVNLPEGVTAKLVGEDYPEITDVDRVENAVTFTLEYNGTPLDEKNYVIDYSYGYLEITPYNFSLRLTDYSLVYNGSAFDFNTAEEEPFGDGNTFTDFLPKDAFTLQSSKAQIINAGSYSYTAKLKPEYKDSNFNIKITGGAIEIEKCGVNVELTSDTFEYSGEVWEPAFNTDIILSGADGNDIFHLTDNMAYTLEDLFSVVKSGVIKNVGVYNYTVKFKHSSDDRNHNLYISGGDITVTARRINITLKNDTVDYNGQSRLPDIDDAITSELPRGLNKSDFKVVSESASVVNASATPYYYTVQMANPLEAGNYELNVTGGSITINKCTVEITLPASSDVTFDGNTHVPDLNDLIEISTLPEHLKGVYESRLKVTANGEIKNVGKYTYTIEFKNSADYDNHNLQVGNGIIQINECTVNVTLNPFKKQYNAEVHKIGLGDAINNVSCANGSDIITNANAAKYFETYTHETVKDVRIYYYGIKFIYKEDAQNFRLMVNGEEGGEQKYEVTPIATGLVSNVSQQGKVFDGEIYTVDTASAIGGGLIYLSATLPFEHTISVDCATQKAVAGSQRATYTNLRIYNEYGDDITRNFKLSYNDVYVTVLISPRDIAFELDNYFCTESNRPRDAADVRSCLRVSGATPLFEGYFISFNEEIIEINNQRNTLTVDYYYLRSISIYNKEGENVSESFNIVNMDDLSSSIIITG